MRFIRLMCMVVLGSSSGCQTRPCEVRWTHNVTQLPVHVTGQTPGELLIDDPSLELHQEDVDRITAEVIACVSSATITRDNLCVDEPAMGTDIYQCMVVKVPKWQYSACTGEQVYDCDVPAESCSIKGQTGSCACRCRGAIQDGYVMVVTPNLKLYAGTLTQYLTGCWYVWTGDLERCASIQ